MYHRPLTDIRPQYCVENCCVYYSPEALQFTFPHAYDRSLEKTFFPALQEVDGVMGWINRPPAFELDLKPVLLERSVESLRDPSTRQTLREGITANQALPRLVTSRFMLSCFSIGYYYNVNVNQTGKHLTSQSKTPSCGIIIHQHRRGSCVLSSAISKLDLTRQKPTGFRPPCMIVKVSQRFQDYTETPTLSIQLTCAVSSVSPNNKATLISNA